MGEMNDDVERVRRGYDTGYKYFLRRGAVDRVEFHRGSADEG